MRFGGLYMQKFIIDGGQRLSGEIKVQGAKNSALPILAASLLTTGDVTVTNCPKLTDTYAACRILSHLGCKINMLGNTVNIVTGEERITDIPSDLMREMRSSIIFLGAVLGKTGSCRLTFPGGCELGPRPIDMHLDALRKMGVDITEEYGELFCRSKGRLKGTKIIFPFPSVGATENVMLAACLADGETEIKNAAREPEIADLAGFLNECGAEIFGAGESTIVIKGKNVLHGCEYKIMPDRIAAVTYMAASAATGGDIHITDAVPEDIDAVIPVFEEMGCHIYRYTDSIFLKAPVKIKSVKMIRTMPYPAFPTDAQAVIMAVLAKSMGTSIFVENIFENRYKHVSELAKMGADIKIEGKVAVISGKNKLYGTSVEATDLRGGAALAVAGLSAEGSTEITDIKHIDRGYENFEQNLCSLNGRIKRV